VIAATLAAPATRAEVPAFETLFRQLVEIDTSWPGGDCTSAAAAIAGSMRQGGFPPDAIHHYADPARPREGGLVAVLKGRDTQASALLLVAHIDVVTPDPGEWTYPPFRLTVADGYYHGRGTSDNKAVAAALIEALVRLNAGGFRPRRDVKVALTCGEEEPAAFNGAAHLATVRRDLADAGMVFVPTAGGALDDAGRPVTMTLQAGEKAQQNFRIAATGTPGHASRPTDDNAIDKLAAALLAVARLRFPVEVQPVPRAYLAEIMDRQAPRDATAIRALLADPTNEVAAATFSANPHWNALIRTTCTTTVIDTGRQRNTVAARAEANVNCRLLPGTSVAAVESALVAAIGNPAVTVSPIAPMADAAPSPPLAPAITAPIAAIGRDIWPEARLAAAMLTGATDARHFNAAGMPAYGLTVMFNDPDGNGVHGPNERIRVRSVDEGRRFLLRLIPAFAD